MVEWTGPDDLWSHAEQCARAMRVRSLIDRVTGRGPVDSGALDELIDERDASAEPADAHSDAQ
ncbi:MAG: hypothetical protein AAGD18_24405 [Actinomycetota bacterium]